MTMAWLQKAGINVNSCLNVHSLILFHEHLDNCCPHIPEVEPFIRKSVLRTPLEINTSKTPLKTNYSL